MSTEPPLSRALFDRAAVHRADEQWLSAAWDRAKLLVLNQSANTLAIQGDGAWTPSYHDAAWLGALLDDAPTITVTRRFLGVVDDEPYFSVTLPELDLDMDSQSDTADHWVGLRDVGATSDELNASLLATAVALHQWHSRHPRCPICGEVTTETQAGWTRTCANDSSVHFPRTDPAVIMLVHDGADRVLLGRGAAWGPGRFSTLAGFVEPGESLESAVAREVLEEVGVRVDNIRYVASQPWPFPASLMVGFTAQVVGAQAIALDDDEMVEAGWFTRDEVHRAGSWTDGPLSDDPDKQASQLKQIPPQFSISRFLIDGWLDAR